MKVCFFVLLFSIGSSKGFSQDTLSGNYSNDSLLKVEVKAFYSNVSWMNAPAAITAISPQKLNELSSVSFTNSFNTVSGVKMEERSPSSYRISIRGSSLRSVFGVRNLKVYWNNFSLTDGGGNTYINLINPINVNSAEILKGAAASMYGAGTGGVVLLNSPQSFSQNHISTFNSQIKIGSYNLFEENVQYHYSNSKTSILLSQNHFQSNGFREQSASNKNVVLLNSFFKAKKHLLELFVFNTSLYYQTPGGITYEQMLQNSTLSRQATTTLPSAIQQKTAIYNNTFYIGVADEFMINENLKSSINLAFDKTNYANPFITNYEKRNENNLNLSGKFFYNNNRGNVKLSWTNGFETLFNHSLLDNYGNKNGNRDTLQFNDKLAATQLFAFSQINVRVRKILLQFGLSCNQQLFFYNRLSDKNFGNDKVNNSGLVAAPRLALSYNLFKQLSFYAVVAKGFSSPTIAEIRPSDGNFYNNLKAESGINYELGLKGNLLNQRINFDLAFYYFNLKNTIVRRNNTVGAEYFINAGKAEQKGIELTLNYSIWKSNQSFIQQILFSNSNSFQPYFFKDYVVGNTNYSGNKITGVPLWTNVSTIETDFKKNISLFISYNYTSAIPLADANDVFAADYRLLQAKINWKLKNGKAEFFVIGDNLLNELYSLGNDINAAGKRYYNPAPQINYQLGFNIKL